MQTEIEAKFLNINHDKMREKLKELGAELVQPLQLMRRRNFDYPENTLEKTKAGWVRVRDEGNQVTLAYKQLNDRSLHGTKEVSVIVGDFDASSKFLEAIGLEQKSYQETKRESWKLDGVEVELDEWPWIPTFLEVEAHSEEELKLVLGKLDLNIEDAVHGSVEIAYQEVYDVTEEEVDHWDTIVFSEVPEWLEEKRK